MNGSLSNEWSCRHQANSARQKVKGRELHECGKGIQTKHHNKISDIVSGSTGDVTKKAEPPGR